MSKEITTIKYVGVILAKKLQAQGFDTIASIANAIPDHLTHISGISHHNALRIIEAAKIAQAKLVTLPESSIAMPVPAAIIKAEAIQAPKKSQKSTKKQEDKKRTKATKSSKKTKKIAKKHANTPAKQGKKQEKENKRSKEKKTKKIKKDSKNQQ